MELFQQNKDVADLASQLDAYFYSLKGQKRLKDKIVIEDKKKEFPSSTVAPITEGKKEKN